MEVVWIVVLFFWIIFMSFWGIICAEVAKSRGREYGLAFVLGILFGIFAIIGYLIAGKTIEKQAEDLKKLQSLMKE